MAAITAYFVCQRKAAKARQRREEEQKRREEETSFKKLELENKYKIDRIKIVKTLDKCSCDAELA